MRASLTAALIGIGIVLAACATASVPPASPSPLPPAASPTAPGPSGSRPPLVVALDQSTDNDVTVEITDASGSLVDASSGVPGDGASVEPYTVAASNVDATTIRLVWTDGPCDSLSTLTIDASATRLLLVQPECPGDAVGFDRVLDLWFSRAVDASSLEISLQDGIDTAY
jgi:hypothetical protein